MKKTFSAAMILLVFFAGSIIAQNGAQIEYKLTSADKNINGTMKIYFSGQNTRTEMSMMAPQMPGGISKISIIKSDKPSTIYSLDQKSKTYTTAETKPATAAPTDNTPVTVKVIGKEKVGKYNCTHAQVTRGKETSDYWTTTEIADFDKYRKADSKNKFMGNDGTQAALAKNGADGFIVKSVTKDQRGMEMTMELVSFEKKDIAASLFEIPADYKLAAAGTGAPTAPAIDAAKLQNMTPEERAKYVEELKKQYAAPGGNK
ncbi:MAG: hypothetical protein JWP12_1815 [Bacteroidetes bacterium]|nr:hypothetical protein [Bacteroidota bacterium]